MSYQTIVAAFDNAAQAEVAAEALKAGGCQAGGTSALDKSRVGLRAPSLWQCLFGIGLAQREAEVYNRLLGRAQTDNH
jgi:hypothetical protein